MLWVLVVVAVMAVVAIALVAVGKVTAELAAQPPLSIFEMDDALAWVADALSEQTQARLSYDDVSIVIGSYLDYLELKGVAFEGRATTSPSGPLVADDDEGLAYVIGRISEAGLEEVSDVDVAEILAASEAYLCEIGAIGARVPGPQDPVPDASPGASSIPANGTVEPDP